MTNINHQQKTRICQLLGRAMVDPNLFRTRSPGCRQLLAAHFPLFPPGTTRKMAGNRGRSTWKSSMMVKNIISAEKDCDTTWLTGKFLIFGHDFEWRAGNVMKFALLFSNALRSREAGGFSSASLVYQIPESEMGFMPWSLLFLDNSCRFQASSRGTYVKKHCRGFWNVGVSSMKTAPNALLSWNVSKSR